MAYNDPPGGGGGTTYDSSWFRRMPYRFLGYGMAVGESVRFVAYHNTVDVCYTTNHVFSVVHVLAVLLEYSDRPMLAGRTAVWEVFASLMPAIAVHHTTRLIYRLLYDLDLSREVKTWIPTVLGLCLCVVLVEPLDKLADQITEAIFKNIG